MTVTSTAQRPAPTPPSPKVRPWRTWLQERGILWGLTQTPLLAILSSLFYRTAPYPFMLLPMLASFVALPIWISHRRQVSTNPDEPAHHLHRYALWALVPSAMFSVCRIPLHYLLGIIYWHPWYDFGNALTGTSLSSQSTLAVGGLLNLIQGWAMGVGFYILFKRHSLINALLYIAVWVSALYSYDFADYSRIGLKSPPFWHASMAWAHWWMALTLWAMPLFHRTVWSRLTRQGRLAAVTTAAVIVIVPSAFAQWRAVTWEYPRQTKIDQALFHRPNLLTFTAGPTLTSTSGDATYTFTLRFGPRDYQNWFKQTRALDAGTIQITGSLREGDLTLAYCATSLAQLPSPNTVTRPQAFPAAMKAMKFTDIHVTCTGPASAAQQITAGAPVTTDWHATITLIGGQTQQTRQFTGQQTAALTTTP